MADAQLHPDQFFAAWVDPATGRVRGSLVGGGVSTFLALADTPGDFTADATKPLIVNAAENAVEYSSSVTIDDSTGVLTLDSDGVTNPGFVMGCHSVTAGIAANLYLQRSRGSRASPATVNSGDFIGQILVQGWESTFYATGFIIQVKASENWSAFAQGTTVLIGCVPTGGTSADVLMTMGDGVVEFLNAGLAIQDTGGDHHLGIKPGANLTANRTMTVTGPDADITLNFGTVTDGTFLVMDGTNLVAESGSTVRDSLGLGTASTVQFGASRVAAIGIGKAAAYEVDVLQSSDSQSVDGIASYRSDGSTRGVFFQGADDKTYLFNFDNGIEFYAGNAHGMSLDASGNLNIGTTASPGSGSEALVLAQTAANLGSMATNTAGLQARDSGGTCEMFAVDENASATQISPHPKDAPPPLYDLAPGVDGDLQNGVPLSRAARRQVRASGRDAGRRQAAFRWKAVPTARCGCCIVCNTRVPIAPLNSIRFMTLAFRPTRTSDRTP